MTIYEKSMGCMRSIWEMWQSSQIEISEEWWWFWLKFSVKFQWNFSEISVNFQWKFSEFSVKFQWNFRRMMVVLVNQWIFRSNQQWCGGVWYLRQSSNQNIESGKIKRWGFCKIIILIDFVIIEYRRLKIKTKTNLYDECIFDIFAKHPSQCCYCIYLEIYPHLFALA